LEKRAKGVKNPGNFWEKVKIGETVGVGGEEEGRFSAL
jgi:hypothetical protein